MNKEQETVADVLKILRMLDEQAHTHRYRFCLGVPTPFTSFNAPNYKIVDVTIGEIANRIEVAHKREMSEVYELRMERDRLKVDGANMRSALAHIETIAKGAPGFSPRTFKEIGRLAYSAIFNEINKEANDETAK